MVVPKRLSLHQIREHLVNLDKIFGFRLERILGYTRDSGARFPHLTTK